MLRKLLSTSDLEWTDQLVQDWMEYVTEGDNFSAYATWYALWSMMKNRQAFALIDDGISSMSDAMCC